MYDEAVHDYADTLEFVPDWCQEMCVKAISKNHFMLEYCHDRYKTQEICSKAVDNFLPALKFVPNWFVTSKIIKKTLYHILCRWWVTFFMKSLVMSHLWNGYS